MFDDETMQYVAVRWWRGVVTALHPDAHTAKAINRDGVIAGEGAGVGGLSAGFVLRHGAYTVIPQPPGELGTTFLAPGGHQQPRAGRRVEQRRRVRVGARTDHVPEGVVRQ